MKFQWVIKRGVWSWVVFLVIIGSCSQDNKPRLSKKQNILLICIDDLRPALGAYGAKHMHTPNIDRLALESRIFTRHYVHAPVCGPSRTAMLTGRRTGLSWDVWNEARQLEEPPKSPVSMGDFFQRNGYRTISIGKVSHRPSGTIRPNYTRHAVPFSWDIATGPTGQWGTPWRAFFGYAGGDSYNTSMARPEVSNESPRLPFEKADVSDKGYPDGLIAEKAVEQLRELDKREEPFFLAVGFFKPHLPHAAPNRYWDLYDREQVGLAEHRKPPAGVDPAISIHESFELTTHYRWPWGKGNIPKEQTINQRKAYYACVSYMDAQVGKVLETLEELGLDKNTIIVLWSDHGWHLGEQGVFGKQTLFEMATRSPLIIKTPGLPLPGKKSNGIVETIDLYPTLADLCNLSIPQALDGQSLKDMILNPDHPGKNRAISIFDRDNLLGHALRTERYRFVEWRHKETKEIRQIELYDHQNDPEETENIAQEHPEIVKRLRQLLRESNIKFRSAY